MPNDGWALAYTPTRLDRSIFILSVDFELLWGYAIHPTDRAVGLLRRDETRGRQSTLALLQVLDRHHVPATWATVGHLFLTPERCANDQRTVLHHPTFAADVDPQLLHAPDLIERIRRSPTNHEVAYHSFSHVRFSECTSERARRELDEGRRVAAEIGIPLSSFVFPENRLGHTDLLKNADFAIYRGQNLGGRRGEQGILRRVKGIVLRRVTAPPVAPVWRDGIWEVPGSMRFGDSLLPFTVVSRAKRGLRAAIKRKMIFHLWLHPQDLLLDPGLASRLDTFLAFVQEKEEHGELEIMTMGTLASVLTGELLSNLVSGPS